MLTINDRILRGHKPFVIAELGCNHMGNPDICEEMIIRAALCGVDAVKLQKRNNERMFLKAALDKPYCNELSYGATYGEHRKHLDWFGEREFRRFQGVADKHGVLLFATPFEEESADFLARLNMPLYKIASCDVTNPGLARHIARFGKPMIISTGGATLQDIRRLTDAIDPINDNYALLHCISTYPNEDWELNLRVIMRLQEMYPDKLIGFSSHHPGVMPLLVARALGASIFEVHFTLNRGWKGTDHGFSMEPRGLETLCQDLKRVRVMIGNGEKEIMPKEKSGFISKMGKGVYAARPMQAGHVIRPEDIAIKSPYSGGLHPYEAEEIIGHELICDCATGVNLTREVVL